MEPSRNTLMNPTIVTVAGTTKRNSRARWRCRRRAAGVEVALERRPAVVEQAVALAGSLPPVGGLLRRVLPTPAEVVGLHDGGGAGLGIARVIAHQPSTASAAATISDPTPRAERPR